MSGLCDFLRIREFWHALLLLIALFLFFRLLTLTLYGLKIAKRPVRAKALIINAFALTGRIVFGGFLPQGVALGYVLLPLRGVLLRLLHTPSFFVFFHSTFHPQPLTLNIQHLSLLKRTPFAFQNESFYSAKGVLLLFKTSPFASQKDSFCFMATFILLSSIAFSVGLTRNCMLSFVKAPPNLELIY